MSITGNNILIDKDIDKLTHELLGKPLFSTDFKSLRHLFLAKNQIKDVSVSYDYNGRISIKITEKEPIALWHHDGKYFLVDIEGDVIDYYNEKHNLQQPILIIGNEIKGNVAEVLNLLQKYTFFATNIQSIQYISGRRWNLYLNNGVSIKLPAENIEAALQIAQLILNKYKYHDRIAHIDLRIQPDKIYITYKNDKK